MAQSSRLNGNAYKDTRTPYVLSAVQRRALERGCLRLSERERAKGNTERVNPEPVNDYSDFNSFNLLFLVSIDYIT